MAHMDDDEFALPDLVINKIEIADGREDANTGNIGLAPEGGVSRQQLACEADLRCDGGCRARTVLRNVFADICNVGVGTRRKTQSHRPHFF